MSDRRSDNFLKYLADEAEYNRSTARMDKFDHQSRVKTALKAATKSCGDSGAEEEGCWATPDGHWEAVARDSSVDPHISEFVTGYKSVTPKSLCEAVFQNTTIESDEVRAGKTSVGGALTECLARSEESALKIYNLKLKMITSNKTNLGKFRSKKSDDAIVKEVIKLVDRPGGCSATLAKKCIHYVHCRTCFSLSGVEELGDDNVKVCPVGKVELRWSPPSNGKKRLCMKWLEVYPHVCEDKEKRVPPAEPLESVFDDSGMQEVTIPTEVFGSVFDNLVALCDEWNFEEGRDLYGKQVLKESKPGPARDFRQFVCLPCDVGLYNLVERKAFNHFKQRLWFWLAMNSGRLDEFTSMHRKWEYPQRPEASVKPHFQLCDAAYMLYGCLARAEGEKWKELLEKPPPKEPLMQPWHRDCTVDATRNGCSLQENPDLFGKTKPFSGICALQDMAALVFKKNASDDHHYVSELVAKKESNADQKEPNAVLFRLDTIHAGPIFAGKEIGVHGRVHFEVHSDWHRCTPGQFELDCDYGDAAVAARMSEADQKEKFEAVEDFGGKYVALLTECAKSPMDCSPAMLQLMEKQAKQVKDLVGEIREAKQKQKSTKRKRGGQPKVA